MVVSININCYDSTVSPSESRETAPVLESRNAQSVRTCRSTAQSARYQDPRDPRQAGCQGGRRKLRMLPNLTRHSGDPKTTRTVYICDHNSARMRLVKETKIPQWHANEAATTTTKNTRWGPDDTRRGPNNTTKDKKDTRQEHIRPRRNKDKNPEAGRITSWLKRRQRTSVPTQDDDIGWKY